MDASYKNAANSSFEMERVFTAPLDQVWNAAVNYSVRRASTGLTETAAGWDVAGEERRRDKDAGDRQQSLRV
jgi:hypothetical protein